MDAPPLSNLSPDEISVLDDFAEHIHDEHAVGRKFEFLMFILVLDGEKPACEFSTFTETMDPLATDDLPFGEYLRELNVPHLVHSLGYRQQPEGTRHTLIFECLSSPDVTPPMHDIKMGSDEFHRRWGVHYGYPDVAIDAFISGNCIRYSSDADDFQKLLDIANAEALTYEDMERLALLPFILPEKPSAVLDCLDIARDYEETIRKAATETSIPAIEHILDDYLAWHTNAHSEYDTFKTELPRE